jgi:hypothetical protein
MQEELSDLPALRAMLTASYEGDEEGFALCEAVTKAMEEATRTVPRDIDEMRRMRPRDVVVAYLRAFRQVRPSRRSRPAKNSQHRQMYATSDANFARIVRHRTTVASLTSMFFLVEAHLAMSAAAALYTDPLNETSDEQFALLGLHGGQWPMAHESAEALKYRLKPAVTATSNAVAASSTKSNWRYANAISAFTSFEAEGRLEYMTWLVTAQLFGAPRTAKWLEEFTRMFELVRLRVHAMCTLRLPVCFVEEEHRLGDGHGNQRH